MDHKEAGNCFKPYYEPVLKLMVQLNEVETELSSGYG